jgi:hypothetical protein
VSGETEQHESGWTTDTLKYYTDQRFEHLNGALSELRAMLDERYRSQEKAMETAFSAADKAVQAALLSAEKAVTKAEVAAEKRFEATNEFRGQLADQAATFLPRTEAEAVNLRNTERINELQDRMNRAEGKGTGIATMYGWVVGAVGLLVAIVAVFR